MTNKSVRVLMAEADVRQWQLAAMLGIREETLCRKLRTELDDETRIKIETVLRELICEQEKGGRV